MIISVDIESFDRQLPFLISDSNSMQRGMVIDVPGGAQLHFKGTLVRKAIGIPEISQYILQLAVDIDVGLFSAWLYDKLRSRSVERALIIRVEILEITENNIRRVISEQIEERR